MKRIQLAVIAAACSIAATTPAHAQFGNMLSRLTTPSGPRPASVALTPDAFAAETAETTRIVMVSVAILAEASKTDMEMNGLKARIDQINGCQNLGELNVMRASFNSDLEALETNEQSEEALRAAYAAGDRHRKELLGAAAYNLLWAGLRNVALLSKGGDLANAVRSNPMLVLQAGSVLQTVQMLHQQAGAVPAIYSHARIIMREEGAEEPRDAESSQARLIEL